MDYLEWIASEEPLGSTAQPDILNHAWHVPADVLFSNWIPSTCLGWSAPTLDKEQEP